MDRQFTASAHIINDQRHVLLIFHRKLGVWLPPGGHMDAHETPAEAARREVREETGLEIEFLMQENVWIDRWNAKSIERPYLCLVEEIPAHGDQPQHQHIDFVYAARLVEGIEAPNYSEVAAMRWFSLEEIEALQDDVDIFCETKQVIRSILSTYAPLTPAAASNPA